jgi:serine/threonine-protein kinase
MATSKPPLIRPPARPAPAKPVDRTLLYGEEPAGPPAPAPAADRTLPYAAEPPDAVSTAATVALPEGASVRTKPGAGGPAPAAATAAAGSTTLGVRSTVLPRVQLVDDRPQLVQQARQRFETVRSLGEGGAGEVLAARDHDIGRQVALKKIRGEVRSPEALVRFVEEIRTIGRLEHPNIIPIHDVGVDEHGDYYFVMKYVDGETIESLIERLRAGDAETHRRFPFEERVRIFRGLLEAVAFAHARGVVHRDIKPANVMVGTFGEVLLMDWGIAKALRGDGPDLDAALRAEDAACDDDAARVVRTQAGTLLGTPLYMSPEQARGEPVDERSDVYSLSALLYEFLFLRHYLEGRTTLQQVLDGVLHQPASIAARAVPGQPVVPMDLRWFVHRGLQKDPTHRYPSVQAMLDRLDLRAEGIVPIQCHITLTKRLTGSWLRMVERHPMLFTLGMLATLGGLVTLLVLQLR